MKSSSIMAAVVIIVIIIIAAAYLIVAKGGSYHGQNSTSSVNPPTASSSTAQPTPVTTTANATPNTLANSTQANSSNTSGIYTIKIANSSMGSYLANGTGWSLYIYLRDTPYSGNSSCYGTCASIWPPFYSSSLTIQPGINASKFGTINRTDGTMQLTYNGYPLYHYSYDTKPGDTKGQGFASIWYIMSPTGKYIT